MAYRDTPQGVAKRKCRNLRTLNNQHFHSTLCILWITPSVCSSAQEGGKQSTLRTRQPSRRGGERELSSADRPGRWEQNVGGGPPARPFSCYLT
jgi:hypothetical protein